MMLRYKHMAEMDSMVAFSKSGDLHNYYFMRALQYWSFFASASVRIQ